MHEQEKELARYGALTLLKAVVVLPFYLALWLFAWFLAGTAWHLAIGAWTN